MDDNTNVREVKFSYYREAGVDYNEVIGNIYEHPRLLENGR